MLNVLRKAFGKAQPVPSGARGKRAYAIGDVHGRLDLLDRLLGRIETDLSERECRETYLVFLGDLIDRGPHSCEVVERLRTYEAAGVKPVFLAGNHEEVLLRLVAGETGMLAQWLCYGGAECLQSYGVDPTELEEISEASALDRIGRSIPREHVEFLRSFSDTFRFGDYLFVHAGIRPGVPLLAQDQTDLRWIRGPFLDDASDHGVVVVHGHTVTTEVDERPNRIGIDTGAFGTGVLTAIGIEDDRRWFLATEASEPGALIDNHYGDSESGQ